MTSEPRAAQIQSALRIDRNERGHVFTFRSSREARMPIRISPCTAVT